MRVLFSLQSLLFRLKKRPGFSALLAILFVVFLGSLQLQHYIVGWDNFSSYFNLPANIFRTFFATWRSYRGLGVPSDSESTDLFRQLFYLVFSLVLPQTMLDQVYILLMLALGVISMYFLGYVLFKRIVSTRLAQYADLFGFFAAFFYLFNLNTLSTFYFPMIMYVNRFALLPAIFLTVFLLLNQAHVSWRRYLAAAGVFLLSSGMAMTATNIVTLLIALILFGLKSGAVKRFMLILCMYLLVQSFWLLPFINYMVQKSSIIRLAPTFVNANETMLNKPQSSFTLEKQLTLYPNFFDTQFQDASQKKLMYFHPLSYTKEDIFYRTLFFTFPLLYLGGAFLVVIRYRVYAKFLWLVLVLLVFLFLSMREFSPLGFLYHFFDTLTPYFSVLFRFGDTKFHPYIGFSGSLLAALFLVFAYSYLPRMLRIAMVLLMMLVVAFPFRFYFQGQLLGEFMYSKVPDAYFSMAQIINSDTSYARVLHLPMSREDYWKSYAWGAFGSSFFHFMIDKPFIDKTFEPASMENAYLHEQIGKLLANMQLIRSEEEKIKRAATFASFLEKVGVKYLIFDDTVQAEVSPRGILLWGKFNNEDVRIMTNYLKKLQFAQEVKQYKVAVSEKQKIISLLTLIDPQPRVSFLSQVSFFDPSLSNALATPIGTQSTHVMQDANAQSFSLYPFLRENAALEIGLETIDITLKTKQQKGLQMQLDRQFISKETDFHYIDVFAKQDEKMLTIELFLRLTPTVGESGLLQPLSAYAIPLERESVNQYLSENLSSFISDWRQLPAKRVGGLRVQLGDYIFPLPAQVPTTSSYVATIGLRGTTVPFALLQFSKRTQLEIDAVAATEYPNCFFDALSDASYQLSKGQGVTIISKNQSTCASLDLAQYLLQRVDHAEVRLNLEGQSSNRDQVYKTEYAKSKPTLRNTINSLEKPNLLRVCGKEASIDDCYNLHQLVNVKGSTRVVFPFEKPLMGASNMALLLSVKNTGYQTQQVVIKEAFLDQFTTVAKTTVEVVPLERFAVNIPSKESLTVKIPRVLSRYSFSLNPSQEGFYGYNGACDLKSGYKTYRDIEGALLQYVENCSSQISQKAPFSADNFSLWAVSYNLLSGKYPRFSLNDGVYSYIDEYVSLRQGYPDVWGFKLLKRPEFWYDSFTSSEKRQQNIADTIAKAPLQQAFTYVGPFAGVWDQAPKEYTLHQDTENEGALTLGSFLIQPLPTMWQHLVIAPPSTSKTFATPNTFTFVNLLPSLWRVELPSQKGTYLLLQNEGFDTQWRAYDSILGVLFGIGKSVSPNRCDGYANCYVLDGESKTLKTVYLFYTPERLMVLGWLVTLVSVVLLFRFCARFTITA